jgi:hypothetical protein
VRGKHQNLIRQSQQAAEQRFVLRTRIAILKVGAPGATDHQRVAGEHAVLHQEA